MNKPAARRKCKDGGRPTPLPAGMVLLCLATLFCLTGITFWPMLDFEFIRYDVREQLLEDPHVQGLSAENIKKIFTTRRITSYYPIRTLTFATDYQLWGYNPHGFKLTNGLIHLANVFLVFWLGLRLLRSPLAKSAGPHWPAGLAVFAAAVYAIHPIVVEPVVWVAGREELLMTLGALGCLHFHLSARFENSRFENNSEERTRRVTAFYAGSAVCCAIACLSNAVGAIIPFLIVTWDLLTLVGPKKTRIKHGTSVLWLIGAATIAIKLLNPVQAATDKGKFLSVDRVLVVSNVYWLNLKSLVWPSDLALRYSKVEPDSFLDTEVLFGMTAIVLTCVVLWVLRRQSLMLFGLLWFVLALGPSAQVLPHHLNRADRFLYLSIVGLVIAGAVGLSLVTTKIGHRHKGVAAIGAGVLLVVMLQITTARQLPSWRDDITMWQNCLRVEPDSAIMRAALAHALARKDRFDEARDSYEAAVLADPNDVEAHKYLALFLCECPDESFRDYERATELASRAAEMRDDPTTAMVLIKAYANSGDSEQAIATANRVIETARATANLHLEAEFMVLRQQIADQAER
jgi:tetratricopeptide (TPR) repeat protein